MFWDSPAGELKETMRRKNDFYPTPEWATQTLLDRYEMKGTSAFECCVGDGSISRVLEQRFSDCVWTNDIVTAGVIFQHYTLDAADPKNWQEHWAGQMGFGWVITNPPFNRAAEIVPLAYRYAGIGIAMLLRLSFLEPVEDRGSWLNDHPPTSMIVLPRISFTGNGKTDSVTCAWMIWEKGKQGTITVAENPKFTRNELFSETTTVESQGSLQPVLNS